MEIWPKQFPPFPPGRGRSSFILHAGAATAVDEQCRAVHESVKPVESSGQQGICRHDSGRFVLARFVKWPFSAFTVVCVTFTASANRESAISNQSSAVTVFADSAS